MADEVTTTEDEWYADLERCYAESGYTPDDFCRLTLESATKNDGLCWPPNIADGMAHMSLIIGMLIKGLIERVNVGYHTPMGPYRITDKGRNALKDTPHE